MTPAPPQSSSDLFEFGALAEARNYRHALIEEFHPWIRGCVLEVGAGIGQMSREILQINGVEQLLALEPDSNFLHRIPEFPRLQRHLGSSEVVETGSTWNAVVSINVLEHIEGDREELARYAAFLRAEQGTLCLFVPARPEIYAPIDQSFGHFRRYSLAGLRAKLEGAGFRVVRLEYFNLIGYFGWWWTFRLRNQRAFDPFMVRLFDRWIFPVCHAVERWIGPPPFGQSIIAVAKPLDR